MTSIDNLGQEQEVPAEVDANIPVLDLPMENVIPLEIQEDVLMGDVAPQNQAAQANANSQEVQNLFAGMVLLTTPHGSDLGLVSWMQKKSTDVFSDPSGPLTVWTRTLPSLYLLSGLTYSLPSSCPLGCLAKLRRSSARLN